MMSSPEEESGAESQPPIEPREFMRRLRPNLFSDTIRSEEPAIAREVLDYHLETLTKRKQEYQFEHLARAVAEKVLCPNLRPQTGPTGGGDAKVDSETFAVASDIAERWFFGETAARERWAFAFSTKEDWRAKVRSDVASIISTGRDYARIIFITSRYAPDKQRAALEDELTATANKPVTVLDRSWLLDKLYEGGLLELAASTLGLQTTLNPTEQIGPNDAARKRQLDELDRQIKDPERYREARYSLAEDCFTSALLARGLERPRSEVEARFAQARRLAEDHGVVEQTKRILYFEAWTAVWWFDDHQRLLDNYAELEKLIVTSPFADDLTQLRNLWQLLQGSCLRGVLNAERIDLEGKRTRLIDRLKVFASDGARPNNALQAKFTLALLDANQAIMERDSAAMERVWTSLSVLAAEGEQLLSVPLESMMRTVEELGELTPKGLAYERLLDSFLPILERRRSTAAAGEALLKRGLQKLEAGKYTDAVRLLGRAELKLAKEEHIEAFTQTMLGIAEAYAALSLPWAARTKLLMAVDRSFAIMKSQGDIPPSLLRSLYELTSIEMHLGRLPQALAAWRYFRTLATQFEMNEPDRADLEQDFHMLSRILGHLLLKAAPDQLEALTHLPDTLHGLDLDLSAMMLLWGLGQEGIVRDRYLPPEERAADLKTYFRADLSHPVIKNLQTPIVTGSEQELVLRARMLGCEIRLVVANDGRAIQVAEAIASAIEAFFATSLHHRLMPYRDLLRVEVREGAADHYQTMWHTRPEVWADVQFPAEIMPIDQETRGAFDEWLRDLIAEIVARSFYIHDPKHWLDEVAGDEEGFSRAISLGHVPILTSSVYADQPIHLLDHWLEDDATEYPLMRTSPWIDERERQASEGESPDDNEDEGGSTEPQAVDHSQVKATSLIDLALWDQAGWNGTGMLMIGNDPPVLAMAFRDIHAGALIFEGWRARFGEIDREDAIRIAIIQGLSSSDPAGYAVTVGRSLETVAPDRTGQVLLMMSRINRMEHPNPENLANFLAAYQQHGSYSIVPMRMDSQPTIQSFRFDLAIAKKKLEVRRAWEIGPNDPDLVALQDDDDPIVPAQVNDPPVRAGLAAVRSMRERQRESAAPSWMANGATG